MSKRDQIAARYPEVLFADGFDDAIVGVAYKGGQGISVAYDTTSCILILMDDMTEMEAVEYFEYNVLDAFVGEATPVFIMEPDEI